MTSPPSKTPFNNLLPILEEEREEIEKAIDRVIRRGVFILGPEVSAFEFEAGRYFYSKQDGVGVASGTDALELALRALGLGAGDEVITVANSAPATVAAIARVHCSAKFIDIEQRGTMNADLLEASITETTKAILPVHLYGQICDMPKIHKIAKDNGLFVVEDAAQAAGATMDWHWGKYSDAVCFSFYPTKNLGALGDGGMIFTDNPSLREELLNLRFYGITNRETLAQRHMGVNSRLDEMQAAILRYRLTRLKMRTEERRDLARYYFHHLDSRVLHRQYDRWENYHLMTIRTKKRNETRAALSSIGVDTAIHYPIPAHHQAPTRTRDVLPETEAHCHEILSLPLWSGMNTDTIAAISRKINEVDRE